MINPLLFCPSVRNIPEVIKSWNGISYDKYIVKMKPEPEAYKDGRDFFLEHKEYTHPVICPDDLVIYYDPFMKLVRETEEYNFSNLCGISNLDEDRPDLYCCKPLGMSPKTKGHNIDKEYADKLKGKIIQVGFTGFSCQFLDRELVKKLSFTGLDNTPNNLDQQMANELNELHVPMIVDFDAYFWHMRKAQLANVKEWKNNPVKPKGYNILVKAGDTLE